MNRKIPAVCVLFLLLAGAGAANSQEPAQSAGSTTAQDAPRTPPVTAEVKPEDLPAKYVELWNTGDPALAKLFDYFMMHSRGARVMVDSMKLQRVVDSWRKSMPDLKFEIEDTITQANKVVMRLNFSGTYKERLFGNTLDPSLFTSPRSIRSTEIIIFALKDGKIREIWEEYDEDAMRHQMGGVWRTNDELDARAKRERAERQKATAKP